MKHFDVIVIGGGHAGTEAADAAARIGAATALVTMDASKIGVMSCNPAIGGLGKGHLVREVDALDGIMGRAADMAGIQFRLLNRRKGPAVQGPRTQADRKLYREAVQRLIRSRNGLEIIESEVAEFLFERDSIVGVRLADSTDLMGRAVVLTAGTFLNGVIHVGASRQSGGRVGDVASNKLGAQLRDLGLTTGRLKTGTPPRLDRRSIDWDRLEQQAGDENPVMLSFLNSSPVVAQVTCAITHTNSLTHDIVRTNLSKSAMYGGHIDGIGPRYCPSIEDKVIRFADKTSHQIFLEPEGLDDNTVYPNGISTSLPADVQQKYVQSIAGLEQARILQPGYAIEYDYFDPRGLTRALAVETVRGLFFAGQINGTTGYEEAAAQGVFAGINAALFALDRDPVLFARSSSYIGVLVDDLVTKGVTEPYRMFTSRAEYRLTLRVDNADQRLTPLGVSLGCVGSARQERFIGKMEKINFAEAVLRKRAYSPSELARHGIVVNMDGQRRTAYDMLGAGTATLDTIIALDQAFGSLDVDVLEQLSRESMYASYAQRQEREAEILLRDESFTIPGDVTYADVPGLSAEITQKLERVRPDSLGQAARIEGMTPAALALLHLKVRSLQEKRSLS